MSRATIYTIGHSTHQLDFFLKLLLDNKVDAVVDVRSVPYSKYTPQYNTRELKHFLNNHGLYYIAMGQEFGARHTDNFLFNDHGYLDFDKVLAGDKFKNGLQRIKEGLNKGLRIVFMCAEKDPIDCHRSILVARAFYDLQYDVVHIHDDGSLEAQDQLYERLLDVYFPDKNQQTIIDLIEGCSNRDALIKEALKLRKSEIAYNANVKKKVIHSLGKN